MKERERERESHSAASSSSSALFTLLRVQTQRDVTSSGVTLSELHYRTRSTSRRLTHNNNNKNNSNNTGRNYTFQETFPGSGSERVQTFRSRSSAEKLSERTSAMNPGRQRAEGGPITPPLEAEVQPASPPCRGRSFCLPADRGK